MVARAFISTTIPYVNASPHLGHAFEYVQADAFARHMAATGTDVYFLSGSDENSLKNVLAAEREGIPIQQFVDRNVQEFHRLTDVLGVTLSGFIRTSVDQQHIAGATEIWRRMDARGDIYSKEYEGLYCVGCEQFYNPDELVDGKCPEHAVEPELVRERNHFFRLSRYGDRLLAALDSGTLRVVPETRANEVRSFIRAGLEDISISRSNERARGWGISVPGDPDQVMYVWIDALTNYINALGWTDSDTKYHRYWAEADKRIHVIGKGVLRFHAVYWPAMLLAADLPLPSELVVHGYITNAGQKLSKTLGNVVDPSVLVDTYGQDAVRYLLLAELSPFGDADFSEERLVARYNTDLANGLGNLVSRITSMTVRYRKGLVPTCGPLGDPEQALIEQVRASSEASAASMARYDHREALSRLWDLVRRCNAYLDDRAPWHLAKAADQGDTQASQQLDTVLNLTCGAVRQVAVLLRPFLPQASERVLVALGEDPAAPFGDPAPTDLAGRSLNKASSLFPRIEQ